MVSYIIIITKESNDNILIINVILVGNVIDDVINICYRWEYSL